MQREPGNEIETTMTSSTNGLTKIKTFIPTVTQDHIVQ